MLPCTKITNVENLSPIPYYWSETVSIRVEIAFDNSASEDFKNLLIAENASQILLTMTNPSHQQDQQPSPSSSSSSSAMTETSSITTPQNAWICAIRNKLSQAVVTSTQVRQSPTSTNFTNSYALERPTFGSTSHPSSQRQYLSSSPSSSSSGFGSGGNGIEFGYKDPVTKQQPTATFILNLAIPYSCRIPTIVESSNPNTTATTLNNQRQEEQDHQEGNEREDNSLSTTLERPTSSSPTTKISNNNNNNNYSYFFCEWEILLLTKEQVGSHRSQSTHFSPFAVMRHAVLVSSAVAISAQVVPCSGNGLLSSSSSAGGVMASRSVNNNINNNGGLSSCLVTVTCKNTCDNHVVLRHVELESPNNWSPALVKDYLDLSSFSSSSSSSHQQQSLATASDNTFSSIASPTNLKEQQPHVDNTHPQRNIDDYSSHSSSSTSTSIVADPWIVRRRTDGQKQYLLYFYNKSTSLGDAAATSTTTTTTAASVAPGSAPAMIHLRSSHQNLLPLSDSLPITLKPSESYTFCFECYGWDFVNQRVAEDRRNVVFIKNSESNNTSKIENKKGITTASSTSAVTSSDSAFVATSSSLATVGNALANAMISLFIARMTVAGRPVLLNHPVKV